MKHTLSSFTRTHTNTCYFEHGLWPDDISATWDLVRQAGSQALPRISIFILTDPQEICIHIKVQETLPQIGVQAKCRFAGRTRTIMPALTAVSLPRSFPRSRQIRRCLRTRPCHKEVASQLQFWGWVSTNQATGWVRTETGRWESFLRRNNYVQRP